MFRGEFLDVLPHEVRPLDVVDEGRVVVAVHIGGVPYVVIEIATLHVETVGLPHGIAKCSLWTNPEVREYDVENLHKPLRVMRRSAAD